MTDVLIYDCSDDIERPVTQNDITLLHQSSECGSIFRRICRKIDLVPNGKVLDWESYLDKLRKIDGFIDSLDKING